MIDAQAVRALFEARIQELQDTFDDARQGFETGPLKLASLQSVAELLHIQSLAEFEDFAAKLFYSCALGASNILDVAPKIVVATEAEVDTLIYSAKRENYLSWLPYPETLGRAENYLVDGNPFSRLKYRDVELTFFANAMVVRNAIAHSSPHSAQLFERLAKQRRYPHTRPADFLLSTRSGSTEMELLFAGLRLTAEALCEPDHRHADALLNPERSFGGDARAPVGDFRCTVCGTERLGHSGGKLGPCATCGRGEPCSVCARPVGSATWQRDV
jgi:hypothetical protein